MILIFARGPRLRLELIADPFQQLVESLRTGLGPWTRAQTMVVVHGHVDGSVDQQRLVGAGECAMAWLAGAGECAMVWLAVRDGGLLQRWANNAGCGAGLRRMAKGQSMLELTSDTRRAGRLEVKTQVQKLN